MGGPASVRYLTNDMPLALSFFIELHAREADSSLGMSLLWETSYPASLV